MGTFNPEGRKGESSRVSAWSGALSRPSFLALYSAFLGVCLCSECGPPGGKMTL